MGGLINDKQKIFFRGKVFFGYALDMRFPRNTPQ